MLKFKCLGIGVLAALGWTSAHAEGNIRFGGTPAIAYEQKGAAADDAAKSGHQPGFNRAVLPPVSPEESEKAIWSRQIGQLNQGVAPLLRSAKGAKISAARVAGDTAPTGPASIAELARALRGNPDLIYEYVRNNIEYLPTWGIQKGEFGALLDNQGTAFDQAALMVALLRQSGYTASFVKGRISLTAAQLRDWIGADPSKICAVLNQLGSGQIPTSSVVATAAGSCPGSSAALVSLKVDHVWVKAVIGGTSYYFDPSFKPHTEVSGINVAAASGYNAASFMSAATAGATITGDYVQGINRANVRNSLGSYANNLASYLRANKPAATLDDVIGGARITPYEGAAVRQTSLPYQDTSVALTEWTDVPANYKPTLRVQYQGIDQTFSSDAIYGRRLTLSYNASNQPLLSLDGAVLATGTATTPGSYGAVALTVTHGAYANAFANQAFSQQIKAGGTFLIGNGWGSAGRGIIDLHRSRLEQAVAGGAAAGSEAALGSSLAVLSSSWIAQVNHSNYITDRLARTKTLFHHQIGIAGYNTAAFVDLPGNMLSVVSLDGNKDKEAAVFFSASMHSSIFESTAVQQTTGGSAVSTVKLIDLAVAANDRIYDAKAANYASAVQPNLVGCTAWQAGFQSAVNSGRRLILPARCTLNEGSWTGGGYYSILVSANSSSIGAIISGGLAGGFSTSPQPPASTNSNTVRNTQSPSVLLPYTGSSFGDPIDMTKGHYLYTHTDLSSGVGEFPMSLAFTRAYTSASRTQDSGLGLGWTSNFDSSVSVASDGFQGMGEDSGLDAVQAVAEKLVSLDLMGDAAKPVSNMVIATLAQRWFGEQITGNTVVVKQGMNGEVFVKLADGTYSAPPGSSARLSLNGDGTYNYETVNKARLSFNSAGKLATYNHPGGVQVRFSYSGNLLTQVANSLGRVLSFNNAGGRISSVSDGSRTVSFAYDGNGNLSSYTNALSQVTGYQYDLPGRMTKNFNPSAPAVAVVNNVYDSLGRVQSQTNANGKLYTYYFAGSRSEEVGPYNQSLVSYVDAQGKVLKSLDPLGRATVNSYDGQARLVRSVLPEGNAIEYEYDDAPCAAQLRCTHNVKTIRRLAKPGSGLAPLVSSFSYESNFNRVASSTDPRLQTTSFTYTADGHPLSVTAPADAQGVQPVTTYAYGSYSPSGFPAFTLQTSVSSKISPSATTVTSYSYNAGNKFVPQTTVLDAGGLNLASTFTYDAAGNVVLADGPRTDVNDTVASTYDAERRPLQVTDALGKVTRNAYDADGRLLRTAAQIGGQWLVSCNSYTPSGRLLKSWGPAETASDTVCPAAAAPVTVIDYAYDDLDRQTRVIANLTAAEGGNRITETAYYPDSAVQSVSRAVGSADAQVYASYTYTPNGSLASVKDARNNLTSYLYDGHDRRSKTQFPDKAAANTSSATDVELYGYDNNSNLVSFTKRNGQLITASYDNLGRVVGRNYPQAADNTSYTYDLLSRQTGAQYVNGSHGVVSAYDNAGRLVSTSAGGKTLSFQYDAHGNRIRTTWPEATPFYVSTEYDALNRPTAIKEQGSVLLASYAYDDLSRRSTVTLGNGTSTSYGYSAQDKLASLAHNLAGTAQDISWNFNRNQAQEIIAHAWSNDIYQWTGYRNGSRSYAANGLNQYTSAAGSAISHDGNGNISGDGVWTYGYDAENRLRSASKSGLAATLEYDAAGRLRQSVIGGATSNLLYVGTELLAEYDGAGNLQRRYVHGPGTDEALVRYEGAGTAGKAWLYADHLGSVVALADAAGNSTATQTYGPYGEPGGAAGNRFGYTGQQYLGALELSYYKARFYSPALGRFLQADSIGYADDMNLYGYVGSNPLNQTDPTGHCPSCIGGITSVLMGGAIRYVTSGGNWSAVIDPKAVLLDAALGAAGAGFANKINQLRRLKDVPVSLGTKLSAQGSTKFEQGLYLAESNAGKYVGQSGQITTRLEQHVAKSRFGAGTAEAADDAVRLAVGGGKTSREVAEQRVLNAMGGPNTPGVLNKANPVGGRPWLLNNPSLGVIDGIFVPNIGKGLSTAIGVGAAGAVEGGLSCGK
ncbi:RHS repeat-associated core domain-containing protein [Massilia sp. NR 4-1]|uniref:RHS repeat-associated core domain-containing protein n=1 Tax=Massilia sp. NR 4-1 TaxID=1678028 RepID=UPI00067C5E80|nr:RHS repeat-associated core domain-containing protein [Massilia sp. NR 4-1]